MPILIINKPFDIISLTDEKQIPGWEVISTTTIADVHLFSNKGFRRQQKHVTSKYKAPIITIILLTGIPIDAYNRHIVFYCVIVPVTFSLDAPLG